MMHYQIYQNDQILSNKNKNEHLQPKQINLEKLKLYFCIVIKLLNKVNWWLVLALKALCWIFQSAIYKQGITQIRQPAQHSDTCWHEKHESRYSQKRGAML